MELNRRERLLALAVILGVAALAGDKFVVSPLHKTWQARAARIDELEESLDKGQMLVARRDALAQRGEEMRQRSLLSDMSVAENQVRDAISEWARTSRLSVTSQKPRWTGDEEDSKQVEFRLSAGGSLSAIAQFLYEVESDRLAFRAENVEIAARDSRGSNLTLTLRFTGLILKGAEQ